MNPFKTLERKVEMSLIEKVVAALMERMFGNWITTVIGVLVGAVGAIVGATQVIPATLVWHGMHVQATLGTAATVLGAVALILAKDKGIAIQLPKVGMILLIVALGLMLPGRLCAQAALPDAPAPSTSNGFIVSSDAMVVQAPDGSYSAGTVVKQAFDAYDFGKTKGNHLYVEGTQGLMPGISTNFYGGGVALQPDLSTLFKKSNIPAANINVLLDGGAGILNTTSGNLAASRGGGYGGVAVKYNFSAALSWTTVRVEIFASGGQVWKTYSTGLGAYFGKH